jgi:hypothetical protein
MSITLAVIGGLAYVKTNTSIYVIGALLIALNLIYNASLGPICYTIIGEVSSTRLRQKTIGLSVSHNLLSTSQLPPPPPCFSPARTLLLRARVPDATRFCGVSRHHDGTLTHLPAYRLSSRADNL